MLDLEHNKNKKILVVELTRMGDVICGLPAIRALKTAYPASSITVLVEPYYKDILLNNPCIESAIALSNTRAVLGLLKAIFRIRKEKFHLAISLSPSKRNSLLVGLCKARYKVGYFTLRTKFPGLKEAAVWTWGFAPKQSLVYKKDENLVERALKPIRALNIEFNAYQKEIFVPKNEESYMQGYLASLRKNPLLIAIHPCSSWKYRNWPKENYIKLIGALKDCDIFLLGAEKDRKVINEIILNSDQKVNSFVNNPLAKVAALIKKSDLFIGGDSGLLHIADAVGTPIIGLFGPSKPEVSGPLSKNAVIIRKDIPCKLCVQKGICTKAVKCMELINAEEVLMAVREKYPAAIK